MKASDITRIDSESGVIMTLIHHPDYYFHSENLLPNHFSNLDNRYIYTAITNLAQNGIKSIDAYNIVEALAASEATVHYADTISVEALNEMIEMSDTLARHSIEEYKLCVNNVLDAAFRRDTFQKLKECQALCFNQNEEDIQQRIYATLDEVMMEFSGTSEIPAYKDVIEDYWEEIKSRQGIGYAGIPFKFPALNDYVTIEKGELIIFGAQQKVGKSIMLLNCAVDLLKQDYSVLYIDSELSSRQFTARLLSHLTGITYKDLTSGKYDEAEEDRITRAKNWMRTRKFTHIYMPFFDQQTIYTTVKKVNHSQPIDVLIVDYFKSTGNETDAFQTYAAMGRCVDRQLCSR